MKLNNSLKSLMALALVVGLAACDTPVESSPSTHEHTFAEEWSKDETHHWHEATCEHADAVEKAEHAWGAGEVTKQPTEEAKGEKTFTCVCGATKVEEMDVLPHTHKFAEEWSKDETHHWKASTCGHADAETKAEHVFGEPVEVKEGTAGTRTWTCGDCGYEKVEAITSLLINYKLPDGTLIDSHTQEVKQGETYSVASPKVKFMAPSIATVEGTMDADGEAIDVVYDYSAAAMETEVAHGQDMGKLYVDATKGLSLSYVMKGSSGDWEQVFRGDTYAIYNGCIRIREAFPAMVYAGDWYDGANAVNNAPWNALLSSNTEEILVTWSINPDGSVSTYKNGVKVFHFAPDAVANGQWTPDGTPHSKVVANFVENMLLEVANVGLKIGVNRDETPDLVTWSMRDLAVGYAMDDAAATAYASQYKSIKGVYVDESNRQIRAPYVSVSKIGSEYSIPADFVPGYTAVSQTVTGTVTAETSSVSLNYTRNGEEKVTAPEVRDRLTASGWNDPSYWVYIADGLTGDFTVTSEYILNAGAGTSGQAWQTSIGVVYDANDKNNRVTARLDWAGWQDGSVCGSHNNGLMWCGSMEEYFAVAADCTVRTTYTRVGNTITCTNIITANSGQYAGNEYFWTTTLIDVNKESIGLALSPEMAKITLVSVKY